MKINDYITFIGEPGDVVYLKTKLLPVNMRLFKSSSYYYQIIMYVCRYIKWLTLTEPDDYKLPHGMSGANAAIPFNIIGIARNRGKKNAYCEIMINPEIIEWRDQDFEKMQSNCGSIRLKEPINVLRSPEIKVLWYDEKGVSHSRWFTINQGGATIQHEIDHNNGILITDKQI